MIPYFTSWIFLGRNTTMAILDEWLLQGQESVPFEATLLPTLKLLIVF